MRAMRVHFCGSCNSTLELHRSSSTSSMHFFSVRMDFGTQRPVPPTLKMRARASKWGQRLNPASPRTIEAMTGMLEMAPSARRPVHLGVSASCSFMIGRKIASTMPPTTMPITAISSGSMRDVRLFTSASTCWS